MQLKNIALTLSLVSVSACGALGSDGSSMSGNPESTNLCPNAMVTLETSKGVICLNLLEDKAPNHVKNFINLAKRGVYDGTLFHRVIPGFMIQAGDPLTKDPETPREMMGTGNATDEDGKPIRLKSEFNDVPHARGILSMARSNDPNSASSQFFIVHKDSFFLDNNYTVFGEVESGMDVVDEIAKAPRDERDNPLEAIKIEKVTINENVKPPVKDEQPKDMIDPAPAEKPVPSTLNESETPAEEASASEVPAEENPTEENSVSETPVDNGEPTRTPGGSTDTPS